MGEGEKVSVSSTSVLMIVELGFNGVDDCERFRLCGVRMSSMSSVWEGDRGYASLWANRARELLVLRRTGDVALTTLEVSFEMREVRILRDVAVDCFEFESINSVILFRLSEVSL